MNKKGKINRQNLLGDIILYVFLFGPAIDVITSVLHYSFPITPGIIIRTLFILAAIFYLIFLDKSRRKLNLTLLGIILILIIGISINNFEYIKNFNFQFFNYTFKFIYLCIGLIYFFSWFRTQKSFNTYLFRIPFLIISITFILAIITHTSHPTYTAWGDGSSGWFNSPNEIGALLCCIFPISLYNAFRHDPNKTLPVKILDISIVIALSAIMLTIGTKAPFIGFIGISAIYFIYRLFTIKTNHFPPTLIVIPLLLISTFLIWPHLPAITNTNLRIDKIQQSDQISQDQPDSTIPIDPTVNDTSQTATLILNGRDDFEQNLLDRRTEANETTNGTTILLFGKFYQDNKKILITERDFHDTFYLFGLLSLIFVIILIAPPLLASIINFFATFKNQSNHFTFIILLSVGITIFAAFISGHTILSPSVASFFMLSFALLLKNPEPQKRTVAFIASAGGHLTQIMQLKPLFKDYNSYLVTEKTPIKLSSPIPVKYVAYCSRKQRFVYPFKAFYNIFRAFVVFSIINPDTIVTTGAHTAVPFCIYGYLFRKKVIYIESFSKNSSPTLTGKILYPFADTFIIQWKSMQKFYPKAKYFGGIY